jgi:hypothetical protein
MVTSFAYTLFVLRSGFFDTLRELGVSAPENAAKLVDDNVVRRSAASLWHQGGKIVVSDEIPS